MTKKDFYRIILKLLGLYLFITVILHSIFNLIISIYYDFGGFQMWVALVALLICGIAFFILVFKPDSIVKILCLDKTYDTETFSIGNLNNVQTFKIGLIILAGLLLINNIAEFISHLFLAFKESIPENTLESVISVIDPYSVDYSVLIITGLKLILGFFILTYLDKLSLRLNKMLKNQVG